MKIEERHVIEEIIELEGNCLHWSTCKACPFRQVCQVETITSKSTLSKKQRFRMALDTLVRLDIMGDENEVS